MVSSGLDRFREAQDPPLAGYSRALAEMRTGRKQTHWIWYVFPQIAGLGRSHLSQKFAIADRAEGERYLEDEQLGTRLLTVAEVVLEHLRDGRLLQDVMASDVDAQKVVASMTLFGRVASERAREAGAQRHRALAGVAGEILERAAAQGYPACAFTIKALSAPHSC